MGRKAKSQAVRQTERQMASLQAHRRMDRMTNGTQPVRRIWMFGDGQGDGQNVQQTVFHIQNKTVCYIGGSLLCLDKRLFHHTLLLIEKTVTV